MSDDLIEYSNKKQQSSKRYNAFIDVLQIGYRMMSEENKSISNMGIGVERNELIKYEEHLKMDYN